MSQTLPRLARLWAVSLLLCAAPAVALAQISLGVSVAVAPPELPVYDQPPIPGDGYIWTPGYWAYGDDGYYWVPGTWVEPPQPEYLWTPGYWGWSNGAFIFNGGYWGRQVGYYGGVSYGFGYGGNGWEGGRWQDGHLFYNQAVVNVGTTHMNNVYNETIVNNRTNITRVSYNGGPGGTHAEATPQQQTYAHQTHLEATPQQRQHFEAARSDRSLLASVNHGKPAVAATARPGAFTGPNVVGARAAGAVHDAGRAPAARSSTAPMHTETPRPPARDEATSRPAQTSTRPAAERPEVARPEAARPEAARPEAARPEAARPEAAPRPAPREAAPREAAPAARPPAPAHEAAPREAPRPQPSREHQEPPRG
jgi:hypothetical protein